jgi:diapolycopene oxygenase
MAAAVRLAAEGHDVSLLEQNSHLGGKMNVWRSEGFTFDMGPTIITMPSVLERLFSSVGRRAEDYLNLVSLDPQWRTFFADGSRFDLYTSLEGMVAELRRFAPEETANYLRFLAMRTGCTTSRSGGSSGSPGDRCGRPCVRAA